MDPRRSSQGQRVSPFPRSLSPQRVQREASNETKITRANMQMKQTPKKKHHRTRGAPIGEIHGLLLPVARRGEPTARQPGEARAEKRTLRDPTSRPATRTLPPSRPSSERREKKKKRKKKSPCKGASAGWRGGRLGRREELGEHSCPGKQEEGQSLSFQPRAPPARRERTN